MNLTLYIYNFLQECDTKISIPNFGIFSIEKTHAIVDKESSKILPPNSKINFVRNENVANNTILAEFISQKTRKNVLTIQAEINRIVQQWNSQLNTHQEVVLEYLGIVSVSQGVKYTFAPFQDNFLEFFGLEPIALQNNAQKDNTLKKSILWGFLVIFPALALIYLGIQNQDLILGKKSFENTKRIKETPKKDSIIIDSTMIKNDTLQVITENENLTTR